MDNHTPFGVVIKILDRDLQPHERLFEWGPNQDPYEGLEKAGEEMDRLMGIPCRGNGRRKRR